MAVLDTDKLITPNGVVAGGEQTMQTVDVSVDSGTGVMTMPALTPSMPVVTNAGKDLVSAALTVDVQIPLCMFDATPLRNTVTNWSGGLLKLSDADTLSNGDDITVTKGPGKVLLMVIASNDAIGDITITGDTVDRNTGVVSIGDTDTITLAGDSTDNSFTAGKGGAIDVHAFVDAYISNKWFTGSVVLSTTEVDLTDVNVYHVSFEQVNDQSNLMINTLDANVYTTNVAAEFDAYLYTLHKDAGSKCHVDNESNINIGQDGETAIADRYFRIRKGNINEALNGATDGFWVDIFYLNAGNTYCQDVTLKVWFTQTVTAVIT